MKITADMLPDECGKFIKFAYSTAFPNGQTIEELKNSDHRLLQNIGKFFEKDVSDDDGNELL